jgi:hypothetical protein
MSKTKSPRFVTATCACGASFEREVKRGRPQKWCPACVEVPFYERTAAPAPVLAEGEEPAEAKPGSEHDVLREVRELIEAEMVVVNAEHKERYAALVASGVDRYVAADQIEGQLHDEIHAVYAKYR